MFVQTAPYIVHLLKVHCHYVFLGNIYMLIVPLSLYSKVEANIQDF